MNFNDNPWSGFLTDNNDILYQAFKPANTTSPFSDYYDSMYNTALNNYNGQLGKMALSGQAPTLTFYDYLQQLDPYNQWQLLSPSERGEKTPGSLNWNVLYK